MLVKEYRICLPLTVAEYRIAQLYMIQKKSREESTGSGSGVEIIVNEPYENGPGGRGQYTFKIYHIGSHLPAWFRSILPKSALRVEEEAWNAYPYTKTRYKCPFVEKFLLEIETVYRDDAGDAENVFGLEAGDLARQVDFIDIVRDPVDPGHYHRDEDPRLFVSKATGRGPLADDWCRGVASGVASMMCSYKLCRVEFRYWGMQNKIERFIHDVALRKTMLRAHRQAWAWQDEWVGLSIDDIRRLEAETAAALQARMAAAALEEASSLDAASAAVAAVASAPVSGRGGLGVPVSSSSDACSALTMTPSTGKSMRSSGSAGASGAAECRSVHLAREPKERAATESQSDSDQDDFDDFSAHLSEEYFDARSEAAETASFATCVSSYTLVNSRSSTLNSQRPPPPPTQSSSEHHHHQQQQQQRVLFLIVHGGSVLDTNHEYHNKHADASTLRSCLNAVAQSSPIYRRLRGRFAVRLVSAPPLVAGSLQRLAAVSPYNYRLQRSTADASLALSFDHAPIATVPLLMSAAPQYSKVLSSVAQRLNDRRREFLATEEGKEFDDARVCIIGDSTGGIVAYDILAAVGADASGSTGAAGEGVSEKIRLDFSVTDLFLLGCPLALLLAYRQLASGQARPARPACEQVFNLYHNTDPCSFRLEPLLAESFRWLAPVALPKCGILPQQPQQQQQQQLHQLHQLQMQLQQLAESITLVETLNTCPELLRSEVPQQHQHQPQQQQQQQPPATAQERIGSRLSRQNSGSSGCSGGGMDSTVLEVMQDVCQRWWGTKRLDFSLHCPDSLARFPVNAMPLLFHASYWESTDAAAFILSQLIPFGVGGLAATSAATSVYQSASSLLMPNDSAESATATPGYRESLMSGLGFAASSAIEGGKRPRRRLTSGVRLKSTCLPHITVHATANHRANDIIVTEGQPQVVTARFMYGPLDMLSLSDEVIDVHALSQPPNGDWQYLGSGRTDSHGKLSYSLPADRRLPLGSHTLKLVARSDLTCADLNLAVVPPNTECVAFSVDGSFAASVSIMGGDPKVRPGSVDVARHWQDLGYLLIYVTARPDMQLKRVLGWLARHNFPHGMLFFADGLSADAMRQKAACLQRLAGQSGLRLHAAYGSAKDVPAYRAVGAKHVFVVGRGGRKLTGLATPLTDGYAAHLASLQSGHESSRPASGSGRAFVRRGCFGLPSASASTAAASSAASAASSPSASSVSAAARLLDPGRMTASARGPAASPRGSSPLMAPRSPAASLR